MFRLDRRVQQPRHGRACQGSQVNSREEEPQTFIAGSEPSADASQPLAGGSPATPATQGAVVQAGAGPHQGTGLAQSSDGRVGWVWVLAMVVGFVIGVLGHTVGDEKYFKWMKAGVLLLPILFASAYLLTKPSEKESLNRVAGPVAVAAAFAVFVDAVVDASP